MFDWINTCDLCMYGCWYLFPIFCGVEFSHLMSLLKGRPAQTILSYKYKLQALAWGPTNTPREFHVETTWKRPFPRRFNMEFTWCVCSRCSDGVGKHAITKSWTVICQTSRTFFTLNYLKALLWYTKTLLLFVVFFLGVFATRNSVWYMGHLSRMGRGFMTVWINRKIKFQQKLLRFMKY